MSESCARSSVNVFYFLNAGRRFYSVMLDDVRPLKSANKRGKEPGISLHQCLSAKIAPKCMQILCFKQLTLYITFAQFRWFSEGFCFFF